MDPQAAALLMREVADRTQLYTSARQLRFAQGNEQLMRRILDDVPEQFRERVRTLAQMDPAAEMARRNELLRGQDDLVRQLLTADERTRPALLRRLSLNQIELNFHTYEATIAPGALRQIAVPGSRLAGWPAVGAAQSHFADALHILHEEGSAVRAAGRYEFYKYMKRFTVAARSAGEGADPRLAELERLAERFANMRDTQRIEAALSEAERSRIVQLFTDYYFESVGRMRQNAVRNPHDWGETGSLARGGSEPLEGLPTSRYRPLVPTSAAGSLRRAGEAAE
jgi:hypothetical protein